MKQNYLFRRERSWLSQFSLFAALLLCCQTLFSQLTIPAGNTYTFLDNRPLSVNDNHERLASIYTAAELGMPAGSTITGIRYYLQSVSAPQNTPMKVYVSNRGTSTSYFSMIYQNVVPTGSPAYSGTMPSTAFVPGGWINIPFTTPVTYTGNNIQVLVETNGGNAITESMTAKQFRWSPGPSNSSQYWYSWTSPFDDNDYGVPEGGRPNIQLFYTTPGAAGNVSFDNVQFTASENTNAVITVNRNGGSTGAISINYATSNGTAIAGQDYTAASGTLTWADGDMTPKTFTIPVAADFVLDNAETVGLTLSNPVGTTIANGETATLTITDVLPPMSGTYTVGAGGDYPSLTNAGGIFQQINTRIAGVSGPLTINIISDLTGETGNIALNQIAGNHPVLIQPYGAPRTVTGSISNSIANLGLIRFEGADNITINGSLAGANAPGCLIGGDASIRQLTFVNNTGANTACILFQSATNGAYNNTIKNVNVFGASPSTGYGIMFRVFPHSSQVPSLVNNQNTRVENCAVKKAGIGIWSAGSTTSNPNTGLVITQNDISATGTEKVSKYAVIISNETNPQVTYNKVYINNSTTDSSETVGLAIGTGQAYSPSVTSGGISGALVANNWITGVVSTVDLGGSSAGIAISGTAFGTPNIVRNNMISNVSGMSQFNYHVAGIWVVGAVASETKLYNNSISLYGDRGPETNQSPSYGIAISGLDPSVEMKNNIVSTTQIATGGGAVKTYAFGTLSTTFNNLISNNNVFYSAGAQDGGFRAGGLSNTVGTSYATLAAWQTLTSKEANSIEVQPIFTAPTDLHLTAGSNPTIEGIGVPIASVVDDIDCQPRSATNPTPGADETNVSGFPISAAAGTNGTISPSGTTTVTTNGSQSYTITPNCGYAIANVFVDGVSQGNIASYTFTNVTTSHTISAVFTTSLPTITASGATTFCAGGSVTLTSSSPTGNVWSTGATTPSITVTEAGSYTVSVNDGTCATPPSLPTVVSITSGPATPTITASGATTFCTGGSVILTSSSATGNVWSNGATTQSITVTDSGSYFVTVNNGSCNSNPSVSTAVTVNPVPSTPTITASGATTFCEGGSVTLTSSSPTGNVWSNGATTPSITVTEAGSYSVSVNNGSCDSAVSGATTVTVNALPATPTITASGATTFCAGGSVILTSSSATGNVWSNGATTPSITVTEAGSYSVSVNNGNCDSAVSGATTVTVNALPATPTITASGATTFCAGGSVTLTSSSPTGNLWSNGATTPSITVTDSGSYSVSVNNGNCDSAVSATTTVTVNALPATPTITASGATTFCAGGSVTLTSSSATGNVWSNGATTASITVSEAGSYSVSVDNGTCTSAVSAATTVTVNALPATPTITASGATTFCEGGSVTLTSSSATGNVWSNGATTASITVTDSGSYSVSVNNGNCDSAVSDETTVTVNEAPNAEVTQSGGIVTATQSDATYTWYTCGGEVIAGETGQAFIPTVTGDYYVVVSNGNCTVTSDCISVTELGTGEFGRDLFMIYPNPVNDVLHIDYTTVLMQVEVYSITGQRLISKNGNATSAQIDMSALPAGMFLVKVTAENASQTFKVIKK
ncbi:T9SS type A sorting domain-containing protein [Flavobacterium longum]|uniref:beta strand repeat-containing protein n=1 Tax=Flavobacterium longum TaxID=1299340 RepID=UPI0039E75405